MEALSTVLAGQHALVIGGGSGIGQAIALGLARAGADVAVAGRRSSALQGTCDAVQALGRRATAYALDATRTDELRHLAQALDGAGAPLDILVNAQGVMKLGKAEDCDEADYDRIMSTNLKSVWFACTILGRAMLQRRQGVVINIASLASFRGFPGNGVYCLSKHGVRALTETLASEWAQRGVRVNAIAPGFFLTDLNRDAMTDERKAKALSRTPMQRFGQTDELAGAAVYLASPAASYVTGATLPVDGGFLASGM